MNWIDGVILAVGISFALFGYWRGFLQSLILLVLFGASLAVSSRIGESVGDYFAPITDSEDIQTLVGLGSIFLGFVIALFVFSLILTRWRRFWRHTFAFKLNRLAGSVLMIGAALVATVGLLTASQHLAIDNLEQDIDDSVLGSFVADTVDEAARLIRIIPKAWTEISDDRNRDALAAPPPLYQPPNSPTELRHLAEYYAPVVFMDTASPTPKADYLAGWDYDSDLDPLNNWNNLNRGDVDLRGKVYYWVLESETHWFIGYGFFHPRDWGETGIIQCTADHSVTQLGCHENDMEGALITVRKSSSDPYGNFLTMETISHSDILSFKDYQQIPSSRISGHFPLCNDRVCDVEFLDGASHPFVYIEAKTHAVSGAVRDGPRWEQNFPGGTGVLYFPTGAGRVPVDGDDRNGAYELVDISDLWGRRNERSIFTRETEGVGGQFLGDDGTPNAASPPWRWADQDLPSTGPGVLFLDPARWMNEVHDAAVPWPMEYVARSYGLAEEAPSLTAKFDWTMPARFGRDTDGDGLTDYFETRESVNPFGWTIHLNACGSSAPAGSISEYLWTIDGAKQPPQNACDGFSYPFPAEGAYQVTLTVTSAAGHTAAQTRELIVQDWLIVSLGDSYASGQGVPDIPIGLQPGYWSPGTGPGAEGCFMDDAGILPGIVDPPNSTRDAGARCLALNTPGSPLVPTWQDPSCNRSAHAGPVQAAMLLEQGDPRTSVTLLHLACSGDTIADLPAQIEAANRLIGDREVDAVVISIGGNDARFSDIIRMCMNQEPCNDENFTLVIDPAGCEFARVLDKFEECVDFISAFGGSPGSPSAERVFLNAVYNEDCAAPGPGCRRLLDRFAAFRDQVLTELTGLDLPGSTAQDQQRVYLTEYPGVSRDGSGNFCHADPIIVLPGWSEVELEWVDTVIAPQLNQIMSAAAQEAGWNLIGGIYDGFSAHGLCTRDTWIVRLQESFLAQGDPSGSIHPNREGNAFYGRRIAEAFRADFYDGGDLDLPRRPN